VETFVHLRTYSDYSLGQSNIKIDSLTEYCQQEQMPALALTDYQNMFGSLEFALSCVKKGIQPILGAVLNIDYEESSKARNAEVLLLVKSSEGHRNLVALLTDLYLLNRDQVVKKVDLKNLLNRKKGLILLCGQNSPIGQLVLSPTGTKNLVIDQIIDHFRDNLFIELTRYRDGRHKQSEEALLNIAHKYGLPIVATNQITHLTPNNTEFVDALLCITLSRYMTEEDRPSANPEHFFKSTKEMHSLFGDLPEAIANTVLIAQKCHFMLEAKPPMLPTFPDTEDEEALLRTQAHQGLEKHISASSYITDKAIYKTRLEYELDVIVRMGFVGYFLIVSDFIRWSKNASIPIGVGRGSSAGSLVAWTLNITGVDPIRFGLLFERFLNPDRVSMPDFDIDFCQSRRDEVIAYVRKKYGEDKVAQIITFGKLQARAVLRDVGRVMQLPYNLVNKICKMIPINPAHPITLQEAIDLDPELRNLADSNEDVAKLFNISLHLEGTHRHVSTHAAGVIISDQPLSNLVPLYMDENSTIPAIQYAMKSAEIAGLIKFDFLGLKTLTVISNASNMVRINHDPKFNVEGLSLEDDATYKLLSAGRTVGIFQFEGYGMKEAIKILKPTRIEELIALTSLYRPGPMQNIPRYINRKHGHEPIEYIHPSLRDVLEETYGIIVYQEQVTQVVQIIAGYTLSEADLVRRAMGKKNKKEMEEQRKIFIRKATSLQLNSHTQEEAANIFDLVTKFASYGFNKSHAAAYSIISYQTAYLKANYTLEFFVASLNMDIDDIEKVELFCAEAKQFNIEILKPCVNSSDSYFKIERDVEKSKIRFGLAAIKGVGAKIIEKIVQERVENGAFTSLWNFVHRCKGLGLNKRLFSALINTGAIESLHFNMAEILDNIDTLLHPAPRDTQQITLFPTETIEEYGLKQAPDFSYTRKSALEYESMGFYLSRHPISIYQKVLKKLNVVRSIDIDRHLSRNALSLNVAGAITKIDIRSNKSNKFAFLKLSDEFGLMDLSLFGQNKLSKYSECLVEGALIICEIHAHKDENGIRISIEDMRKLDSSIYKSKYKVVIHNQIALGKLKQMLQEEQIQDAYITSVVAKVEGRGEVHLNIPKQLVSQERLLRLHANGFIEVSLEDQ